MPSKLSKLHHAAASGSVGHTLDLLSRCSSDIDRAGGDNDWTPLMFAADTGYLRVIRILLKWGADVSAKTVHDHTALHNSVRNRHLAVTKALIKAGADLEAKTNRAATGPMPIQGHTPLHLAAAEGFCEGTVALIDAGASIGSRMNNGSTPLYLSACLARLEAARVFLRAKANLQSGANEGDTETLEAAAHMSHEDIVALLRGFGVMDTAGTALCAAIEGRAEACVKLLMRRRGGHAISTCVRTSTSPKVGTAFSCAPSTWDAFMLPDSRGFCSTKEPTQHQKSHLSLTIGRKPSTRPW